MKPARLEVRAAAGGDLDRLDLAHGHDAVSVDVGVQLRAGADRAGDGNEPVDRAARGDRHECGTHNPALSETNGDPDGECLFINDRLAPRIGLISLPDFETRQIVVNPILRSGHGGAFATPNTEYIIEASQYPGIPGRGLAVLSEINETFRGGVTCWTVDREAGRISNDGSFSIDLPPYSQDLSDTGKLVSDAWSFTNSACAEEHVAAGLNRDVRRSRPAARRTTPTTCA